jgi:hypothetical protein
MECVDVLEISATSGGERIGAREGIQEARILSNVRAEHLRFKDAIRDSRDESVLKTSISEIKILFPKDLRKRCRHRYSLYPFVVMDQKTSS